MFDLKQFLADPEEKPLDRMNHDGGFTNVFRTIGCIGDSLSSGEMETLGPDGKHMYIDCYEHSWGQYLARMTGAKVFNFSKGGMTAKAYFSDHSWRHRYWDTNSLCQAYIIALGLNDLVGERIPLGKLEDCYSDTSVESFAYYYGKILRTLQEKTPHSKIFLVTMPRSDEKTYTDKKVHRDMLEEFAKSFPNTYLIDLFTYGPVYDSAFKKAFYLNNHLNAMGYYFTARMFASYIDYIIRHNVEDFRRVALIGSPNLDFSANNT